MVIFHMELLRGTNSRVAIRHESQDAKGYGRGIDLPGRGQRFDGLQPFPVQDDAAETKQVDIGLPMKHRGMGMSAS